MNILVMLLLCLNWAGIAKAQVLDKKVSLQYKNNTIEEALKDISKKHQVNFSYSSNVVPLKKRITLTITDKPLRFALKELFKGTDITFEALGSQIVLKKTPKKTVPEDKGSIPALDTSATVIEDKADSIILDEEEGEANISSSTKPVYMEKDTVVYFPQEQYEEVTLSDSLDKVSLRKKYLAEKKKLRDQYYQKMDSLDRTGSQTSKENLKTQFNRVSRKLKTKIELLRDSLSTINILTRDTIKVNDSTGVEKNNRQSDSSGYKYSNAQVTFVPPIGSHGTEAGRYVNHLSFNVVAGHAAGLEGFELGGVINIEKDFVYGAQISGLGNIVGGRSTGGQISGLFNINNKYTQGIQFAGFMNLVSDSIMALQFSGFTNIVKEKVSGGQVSGFLNLAKDDMQGAQVAGFMNIADTLRGAQVAGFMNVAKHVKGAQVGFINIADSVTGAQFGLISFGGYRKLEIYGSETLYGNLAFKTGSRYLYNIFAVGVQPTNEAFTFGIGYGLGSEIRLSRKTIVNLDALAYSIHQDGFQYDELNLLNQFRATFGYLLTRNTSIFAGPVFNVMVSNHFNNATGEYGSQITPKWNFYSHTEDNISAALWVGFNAGIRF